MKVTSNKRGIQSPYYIEELEYGRHSQLKLLGDKKEC